VEEVATVSRISNFIVDQSVNIYLTYSANKNQQFLEGGYVDVIFAGSKANGFEIPREAIVDKHFVYELKDAQIKKTPIKVVRQLNDMVIISGIDNSKTIVTESLATIHPGMDYMAR